jgi:dTMP kinase
LQRILSGRTKLKYHEAGMDLGLSREPAESFRLFQSRVLVIYDELVREFGLDVIDATADISQQQQQVRTLAAAVLSLEGRGSRARRG